MATVEIDVLTSASKFCRLLADARRYNVPGTWSGSAYQSHPCGLIVGAFKLTNKWNTNDYCSIQITDGDGWGNNYSRDPLAGGNPHPPAINGSAVTIWSDGRWVNDEFKAALEPKVRAILAKAEADIAVAVEAAAVKLAADRAARAEATARTAAAAIARATA